MTATPAAAARVSEWDPRAGRCRGRAAESCPFRGGDMHADAILDRLKNSSYIIELRGRSLRESTAVARKLKAVNKKETDN